MHELQRMLTCFSSFGVCFNTEPHSAPLICNKNWCAIDIKYRRHKNVSNCHHLTTDACFLRNPESSCTSEMFGPNMQESLWAPSTWVLELYILHTLERKSKAKIPQHYVVELQTIWTRVFRSARILFQLLKHRFTWFLFVPRRKRDQARHKTKFKSKYLRK